MRFRHNRGLAAFLMGRSPPPVFTRRYCGRSSPRRGFSDSSEWSEWRDSNPRPLVPQTSALTGLRYTPTAALIGKRRAHDNAFCRKMAIELTPIALEREFARPPANPRAARAALPVRRLPAPVCGVGAGAGGAATSRRARSGSLRLTRRRREPRGGLAAGAERGRRGANQTGGRPALSAASARP